MVSALHQALRFLACPICGSPFDVDATALTCGNRHAYDIARAGYVNFAAGRNIGTGDSPAMVQAREQFLGRGWYDAIPRRICTLVERPPGLIVDLAGGTGHYLTRVLEGTQATLGICLDLSSAALKRAARCHDSVAAVGADVWQRLPLADGSADLILSIFGPRNPAEVSRVLTPDGRLIAVTPTERHLAELHQPMGLIGMAQDKAGRLDGVLTRLTLLERVTEEFTVHLEVEDIVALVMMGPNARHREVHDVLISAQELHAPTEVTVSIDVSVYRLS